MARDTHVIIVLSFIMVVDPIALQVVVSRDTAYTGGVVGDLPWRRQESTVAAAQRKPWFEYRVAWIDVVTVR
ncbi:uncharacterized protein IUM83_00522 [Phytophthora cinnamomi]|uniref:uncharacterized protein n=1 Tax=Phytophthora cinnamomi TaxID=4785 RepID=UPI00355A70DF|nr:hypothetical protein IUM83_00522 [Phytophthora cinnamomi]